MRWYSQVAMIAVVGGLGFAGYTYWPQIRSTIGLAPAAAPAGPQAGAPGRGGPQTPPVVDVTPVTTDTITEVSEAVGTTRALESVMVTSKVTGIVERILFEEGQTVSAGQELVRLDAAERQAELEAARAAIQTAEAQRNELSQRLDRARQLRSTGAGTEAQVADLQLQMRTSESNIVAAQARERAAAARLDDLIVRAPFAGRVGVRQVSVGALLETRTAITTLDDLSKVRLDFSVPEILLSRLRVGTPVRTQTVAFGQRSFEGEVAVIDTRVDPLTRSVRLTALIPNRDGVLRPGMFMNVSLTVATRENTIVIPEESILGEGARQVAFVVKDGRVERRVLRTGQRQPGRIEVLEGLDVGEMIVVRGLQRVRQGLQVTARPISNPAASARSDAAASGGNGSTGRAQSTAN